MTLDQLIARLFYYAPEGAGVGAGGSDQGNSDGNQQQQQASDPPASNQQQGASGNQQSQQQAADDDDDEDDEFDLDLDNIEGDVLPEKLREGFQRALERHGTPKQAAATFYRENFRLRNRNRTLATENQQLRASRPGKGRVVMPQQEATLLQQYRQLGTIEQIQQGLTERQRLQSEVATTRKDQLLREVAEATNFNLQALKDVGGNLQYVGKDVEENGQKVRRYYVKVEHSDKTVTETPVDEYFQQNKPHLLPALTATGNNQQQSQGRRIVGQGPAGGHSNNGNQNTGAAKNVTSRYVVPTRIAGTKEK